MTDPGVGGLRNKSLVFNGENRDLQSSNSASASNRNQTKREFAKINCNGTNEISNNNYFSSGETLRKFYSGQKCREATKRQKNKKSYGCLKAKDLVDQNFSSIQVNGNRVPGVLNDNENAPIINTRENQDKANIMSDELDNIRTSDQEGFSSDASENEFSEKCPICLLTFRTQEVGTPENCNHKFCVNCIEEWSHNVQTCPIDRTKFQKIKVRASYEKSAIVREISITAKTRIEKTDAENEIDITNCEVCRSPDSEDVMLLCDGCNKGYHIYCLTPTLNDIPSGSWYCPDCFYVEQDQRNEMEEEEDLSAIYDEIRNLVIPDARLRIVDIHQPRILRTRQNMRILTKISKRTKVPVSTKSFTKLVLPKTNKKSSPQSVFSRLSLFGNSNELEYFSDDSVHNEFENELENGVAVQTAVRFINLSSGHRNRKGLLSRFEGISNYTRTSNVLSDILDVQERWHTASRNFNNVHIEQDGLLRFEDSNVSNPMTWNYASDRNFNSNSITQAPMNSRPNRQNSAPTNSYNRYTSQSNNRAATGGGNRHLTGTGSDSGWSRNNGGSNDRNDSRHNLLHNDPTGDPHLHLVPNNRERIRNMESNNARNQQHVPISNQLEESRNDNDSDGDDSTLSLNEQLLKNEHVLNSNVTENVANTSAGSILETSKSTISSPPLVSHTTPIAPLAPPPWNNTLFQLTADYELEDDDDSNCPNFCVYSAQSQQVAKSTKLNVNTENDKQQKEDDENEDLVQLDDDDEMSLQTESSIDNALNRNTGLCGSENNENEVLNIAIKRECSVKTTQRGHTYDNEISKESNDPSSEKSGLKAYGVLNTEISLKKLEMQCEKTIKKIAVSKECGLKNNDHNQKCISSKIKLPDGRSLQLHQKGVLELYDDSDWEETGKEKQDAGFLRKIDNTDSVDKTDRERSLKNLDSPSSLPENYDSEEIVIKDKETHESEIDRSYTPCLDEKNEVESQDGKLSEIYEIRNLCKKSSNVNDQNFSQPMNSDAAAGTELISEDDINKSDEDLIVSSRKNYRSRSTTRLRSKSNHQFKKVSKSQKERNYRTDKQMKRDSGHGRAYSRSKSKSNEKENGSQDQEHRWKNLRNSGQNRRFQTNRIRRQELPRYDVRYVVNQQRSFRDPYGRNTLRPQHSRSESRARRRRSYSRSTTRSKSLSPKRHQRSFTISPSPLISNIQCKRSSVSIRQSSAQRVNNHPSETSTRARSRSCSRISRSNSVQHIDRLNHPINRIDSKQPSCSSSSSAKHVSRIGRLKASRKNKSKRSKDRKKKKNKKQTMSTSPSSKKSVTHEADRKETNAKRKRHYTPKGSTSEEHSWSPSPSPQDEDYTAENSVSWTPPLMTFVGNKEFDLYGPQSKTHKEKKKREKKKKKNERRNEIGRKEKRRRRSEIKDSSPVVPSKEVFASGNNILVSVSFNKDNNMPQQTTVVTLPPTREEVVSSNRRSKERQTKKKKDKPRRMRKKIDIKPVAIIDLERSPFQVHQEPADVIILTDSDEDNRQIMNDNQESDNGEIICRNQKVCSSRRLSVEQTPQIERNDTNETLLEGSYEAQQMGPKTPPEPALVKFSFPTKKQAKVRNPLTDMPEVFLEEDQEDKICQEIDSIQNIKKIGPNTPPESGPCSPDVYDPFDPTKSPSISPRSPTPPQEILQKVATESEAPSHENDEIRSADKRGECLNTTGTMQQEKSLNPVELVMALMNAKANNAQEANVSDSQFNSHLVLPGLNDNAICNKAEDTGAITVLSNVLLSSGKSQHIPSISTPPLSRNSQSICKLPIPIHSGISAPTDDSVQIDIESPYSPGSADYEDLFEPPPDIHNTKRRPKRSGKIETFDNLFGNSSPARLPYTVTAKKQKFNINRKSKTFVKVGKLTGAKNDEHIKIYDDLPNSAVELQVKDKVRFLRKLNRQERVVEEVKLVLKPRFNKNQISKEDYKEIMRRAVPKICHSKSGEINPKKIKNLIEAYVKKFRAKHKKLNVINTGQVSSAVKCAAYLKKL